MDPKTLIFRLITATQREDNTVQYFEHHLTAKPMPHFKNRFMNKAKKSEVRIYLVVGNDVESTSYSKYILDGGVLLHKARWVEGETYQQIIDRYIKHVKNRSGDSCLVFDGYDMIGTTKDHMHQRRTSNKKTSASIRVSLPAASINQDQILLNNKKSHWLYVSATKLFIYYSD